MEVERIPAQDIKEVRQLWHTVYNMAKDIEASPEEEAFLMQCGYGIYDGGKLASSVFAFPMEMRFNGRDIMSAGIGSVGTYPEYRGKGHIQTIFSKVFADLYAAETPFSTLYPFSYPFYRALGYEFIYASSQYEAPIDAFYEKALLQTGSIEPLPLADYAKAAPIYEQFRLPYALAFKREPWMWRRAFKGKLWKDQSFAYLWRNRQGQAEGYFKFDAAKANAAEGEEDGALVMKVRDMAWLNHEALRGMLASFYLFSSQYSCCRMELPASCGLAYMLKDQYALKETLKPKFMARIVHAAKALELCPYASAQGEAAFKIADAAIPQNNSVFSVVWHNGKAAVQAAPAMAADIEIDIASLLPLVFGAVSLQVLAGGGRAKLLNGKWRDKQIFASQKLYLNDYF